jgi:hypothetical protein
MPDKEPAGPITVDFHHVGRDQRSWSKRFPALDLRAIAAEARKACLSSDIFAVYDLDARAGQLFAGPYAVGTFTIHDAPVGEGKD